MTEAEACAALTKAERDAARAERKAAKVAAAEGEAKGLRLALEEAKRPFWRRWLG
jgi:flagellar biosynthesis/type III secretory pathway protein FliH